MELTDTEKAELLFFLGYSGFEDDGPAIRAINSLNPFMIPIVRRILGKLHEIDEQIQETIPLSKAISTGGGGGVQVRAHYTLDHLWRLGRQQVSRLATWTKIWICSDVFGTGSRARGPDFYGGDPSEKRINPREGLPTIGDYGDAQPGAGSLKWP